MSSVNSVAAIVARFLSRPNAEDYGRMATWHGKTVDPGAAYREIARCEISDDVVTALIDRLRRREPMQASAVLGALVLFRRGEEMGPHRRELLERLMRHFEVRKGLRLERGSRDLGALALSALACLLNDAFEGSGDWRYFNTALKVNDAIWRLARTHRFSGVAGQLARQLAGEAVRFQEGQFGRLASS